MNEEMVEKAYQDLGHKRGWRFMTCPEKNLRSADNAIITLNPGEEHQPEPKWSMENGISYFEQEQWGEGYEQKGRKRPKPGRHSLQLQVQQLADQLNWNLAEGSAHNWYPFVALPGKHLGTRRKL